MKQTAIILLFVFITAIALAWLCYYKPLKSMSSLHLFKREDTYPVPSKNFLKLQAKTAKAKSFARDKKFNTNFCFLIDMSLPSYQNRFFIYDLIKDSTKNSGLVTHGRCNEDWLEGRKYSNTPGCGCTSIGRYKIGSYYQGRFGLAFKLYGLDKSNDNAFKRFVVLHSHSCVPETEVNSDVCQSDGCPMVSPGFLKALEAEIKKSAKPVLLWIYN